MLHVIMYDLLVADPNADRRTHIHPTKIISNYAFIVYNIHPNIKKGINSINF